MTMPLRVLILEDRSTDVELMLYELRQAGFEPEWQRVETEADYVNCLRSDLDVILSDYTMPQFDASRALQLLQNHDIDVPFIIVTGTISEEIAVACMKQGATDYLLKDRLARLGESVKQALQQRDLRRAKQQAQAALHKSVQNFLAMFEFSPISMAISDTNGRFLQTNQAFLEMFGYAEDDLYELTLEDLTHPDDRDQSLSLYEKLIKGKISHFRREKCYHRKNGQILWGDTTVFIINNTDDESPHMIIDIQDVTERRHAERALRASEERFRQVVASISDHIYMTEVMEDGQHLNLYLSPNVEELTGYPREKFMIDWNFWAKSLIHPVDRPAAADHAAQLAKGQSGEIEYRMIRADGEVIWVRDSARVESQGSSRIVYGVVGDITERKRTELELRQAQKALEAERASLARRVEERTAELSAANAELARASRLKDEFLASMSHELRTPLNAILGMSEVLQTEVYGQINEQQRKSIKIVEESGRHLLDLINDILDLSKVEAGKLELDIAPVQVELVCGASLQFIKQGAHKKQIKISSKFDERVEILQADQRRLKQILVNLLSNAVKFTPEGGQVGLEVAGDMSKEVVHFTVWDTGVGIPAEHLDQLFQPFVQLDSSLTRQYEGTGLGLSLVYRLTEMHGGSISIESKASEGSRFTVSLPWHSVRSRQSQNSEQASSGELNTNQGSSNSQALILVAEDNEANISTVSEYLGKIGYQVKVARNGLEAIEQAKKVRPNLILMDIQMPEIDGLEAIRRIRQNADLPYIPIIALTALAMPGDRDHCLAAGADEYMSKPISLKKLVEIIEIQLRQNVPKHEESNVLD